MTLGRVDDVERYPGQTTTDEPCEFSLRNYRSKSRQVISLLSCSSENSIGQKQYPIKSQIVINCPCDSTGHVLNKHES